MAYLSLNWKFSSSQRARIRHAASCANEQAMLEDAPQHLCFVSARCAAYLAIFRICRNFGIDATREDQFSLASNYASAVVEEPESDDENDCPFCDGTGEGSYDGASCRSCRGSGYRYTSNIRHNYEI